MTSFFIKKKNSVSNGQSYTRIKKKSTTKGRDTNPQKEIPSIDGQTTQFYKRESYI